MSGTMTVLHEPELATPNDGGDIDHLDFKFAIECESPSCDEAATYRMVKECCEKMYLFCEKHTVHYGSSVKKLKICLACNNPHTEQIFSAVDKF